MKRNLKIAFTLAEVLITLGIIGVVAAMTMPSLIQKHQERETVVKLKKFYSTISQSYLFAVQEYGTPSEWGITGRDVGSKDKNEESYAATNAILVRDRLLKNVKKTRVCDNAKNQKACGFANEIYFLDGQTKDSTISGSSALTASAALADGSSVMFIANGAALSNRGPGALAYTAGIIYYDINGIKPPNTYGKDFFFFYLTNQNIMPCGTEDETLYTFNNNCVNVRNQAGVGCTAWVIFNENMDYLHCDDLSWNGKHKCSD